MTPFTTQIKRQDSTIFVTLTKKGYKQLETAVIPSLDGGSLAGGTVVNLLFLPIINDIVDYNTKANYSHKPNPLMVTLIPDDSADHYHLVAPSSETQTSAPIAAKAMTATVASGAANSETKSMPVAPQVFKNGLGLKVQEQNDQIFVTRVLPFSAASLAGIQVGDEILAYNDVAPASGAKVLEGVINAPFLKSGTIVWRSKGGTPQTAKLDWST